MKSRSVIFAILGVLLVPFVYGSASISDAFAAIRDPGYDGGSCTGNKSDKDGKTCCWRVQIPGKYLAETYCQTCKTYSDSKGTYERCTNPTLQAMKPTDESGPAGQVLEEQTTSRVLPNLSQNLYELSQAGGLPTENITLIPGGILKTENNMTFSQLNLSSSNSSDNILGLKQSDLVSDEVENSTRTVNEGEEQDKSGTSEEVTGQDENNDDADENENDVKDNDNNNEDSQPQE